MDAKLKQRVVGAAVLVALFVIFIPMFLHDSGDPAAPMLPLGVEPDAPVDFNSHVVPLDDSTMDRLEEAIEATPEALAAPLKGDDTLNNTGQITEPVLPGHERDEGVAPIDAGSQSEPLPVAEPTLSLKPAPDAKAPRTSVNAWVVQLGSFAAEINAVTLVETLKAGGFAAFIQPLQDSGKVSYRVRVGPELTQEAAQRVRDALSKKVDIMGIVMRYP